MKNSTLTFIVVLLFPFSALFALDTDFSGSSNDTLITVRDPIMYSNTQYGFNFSLPPNWQGYSIVTERWSATVRENTVTPSGPKLLIRNPKWTAASPYEDLPILVFTLAEWQSYQKEDFTIGAAPTLATELARNNAYVFALPARWDFDYRLDYKEAQDIISAEPLRAYNIGVSVPPLDTTQNTDTTQNNPNLNVVTDPTPTKTESVMVTMFQLFGGLFIAYPLFAMIPVIILGMFYFQTRNNFIFITLLLWFFYMLYEELHLLRILCTGECNIRIDLLVIYPLLIVMTLIALFLGMKNLLKSLST